jgi:hypothetical protein
MSNKPSKSKNTDIPVLNKVGTLSENTTWVQMRDYKPHSTQGFPANRKRNGVMVKGGHQGVDFGKPGTSIGLGSEITSMTDGEAWRFPYTYFHDKNGKLLAVDYAVVVIGTDENGQKYKITYGHLTEESSRNFPTGTRDGSRKTVPVQVGTVLGKVSENSLARGSNGRPQALVHHLHLRTEVWGRNPKTGKVGFYPVDPLEFIQVQDPVYQQQSNTNGNLHVRVVLGTSETTSATQQQVNPSNPVGALDSATAPTAELRKLVALAMQSVRTAETVSDKTLKPVARTLLKYGVSQEIVMKALTDHHTHVSDRGLSAEAAALVAEKAIAEAASDLQVETTGLQASRMSQQELV